MRTPYPEQVLEVVKNHPGVNIVNACTRAGVPWMGCNENGYGMHTPDRERIAGIPQMLAEGKLTLSAEGGLYPRVEERP